LRRLALSGLLATFAFSDAYAVPVVYPNCVRPDASFSTFLKRFDEDAGFRAARLALPLAVRQGDGITVPSQVETWGVERIKSLKEPLYYSRAERDRKNLRQSIDMVQGRPVIALVSVSEKAESDAVKLQYWFRRHEGCWLLYEFDDWSE
jgi:hypothetical protein